MMVVIMLRADQLDICGIAQLASYIQGRGKLVDVSYLDCALPYDALRYDYFTGYDNVPVHFSHAKWFMLCATCSSLRAS